MPIGLQHPAIGASSAQPTLFQRRVRFQRDPKGVCEIHNCMDARGAQRGNQVPQQVVVSHGFSLAQEHGARSSANIKSIAGGSASTLNVRLLPWRGAALGAML